ncbi:MAG: hypothetical protein JWM58_1140 [Rhizobium sp.]|nr:hypothetical protein [Rhizobium sp.]
MIEYEKFIYLDVYKTGSSHIKNLLPAITEGKQIRVKRHGPLTSGRPYSWTGGKLVFATVRNPWDWYVSLWSFAREGGGAMWRFFSEALPPEEVQEMYDAGNPVVSFGKWLHAVNDKDFMLRVIKNNLPESGLAGIIGLYTFRFMRVTTPYPTFLLKSWMVPSIDAAIRYQRWAHMYREVLRMESLNSDLKAFVGKYRERCDFKPDAEAMIDKYAETPRNTSIRLLPSYRDYYTEATRQLVADKDRLFIELFGYKF